MVLFFLSLFTGALSVFPLLKVTLVVQPWCDNLKALYRPHRGRHLTLSTVACLNLQRFSVQADSKHHMDHAERQWS